jgi:hypothetical protein
VNPAWSYVLTAVGIVGLSLAGRKQKTGWLVGLLAQILWAAYGVQTHQYGFLLSAFIYGYVYAENYWRWRKTPFENVAKLREAAEMWEKVRPHVEDIVNAAPDVRILHTQKELAHLIGKRAVIKHIISPDQRDETPS